MWRGARHRFLRINDLLDRHRVQLLLARIAPFVVGVPPENETAGFVRMETGGFEKYLKTLERVKGIEPSYSAWKSPDFRNVFKSRSDILQLSGRLRSLGTFSLSEWRLHAPRSS